MGWLAFILRSYCRPVLSEESIQKVVNALGCSKARAKNFLKLNDNDADQAIVRYKYVRRRPDGSFLAARCSSVLSFNVGRIVSSIFYLR